MINLIRWLLSTIETVKIDTGNNIDKFINSINNSKVPVQAMKTEIDNLTSSFSNLNNIEDQAGKSSALTSILNILDNAKTKFQALQELFKGSGNSNWLTINSDQINKIILVILQMNGKGNNY